MTESIIPVPKGCDLAPGPRRNTSNKIKENKFLQSNWTYTYVYGSNHQKVTIRTLRRECCNLIKEVSILSEMVPGLN